MLVAWSTLVVTDGFAAGYPSATSVSSTTEATSPTTPFNIPEAHRLALRLAKQPDMFAAVIYTAGIRFGQPQSLSVPLGLMYAPPQSGIGRGFTVWLVQAEPGLYGGKVGLGYGLVGVAPHTPLPAFITDIRLSYFQPWFRTKAKPSVGFDTTFLSLGGLGVLRSLTTDDWYLTWHVGFETGVGAKEIVDEKWQTLPVSALHANPYVDIARYSLDGKSLHLSSPLASDLFFKLDEHYVTTSHEGPYIELAALWHAVRSLGFRSVNISYGPTAARIFNYSMIPEADGAAFPQGFPHYVKRFGICELAVKGWPVDRPNYRFEIRLTCAENLPHSCMEGYENWEAVEKLLPCTSAVLLRQPKEIDPSLPITSMDGFPETYATLRELLRLAEQEITPPDGRASTRSRN
jgi:hypothetical protein